MRKQLRINFEGVNLERESTTDIRLTVRLVERELLGDGSIRDKNSMALGMGEDGLVCWMDGQTQMPLVLQLRLDTPSSFHGAVAIPLADMGIPGGDFSQWFTLGREEDMYAGDIGLDDDRMPRILVGFHWVEDESIDPSLASTFEDHRHSSPVPSSRHRPSPSSTPRPPVYRTSGEGVLLEVSEDRLPLDMIRKSTTDTHRMSLELRDKDLKLEELEAENNLLKARITRLVEEAGVMRARNQQLEIRLEIMEAELAERPRSRPDYREDGKEGSSKTQTKQGTRRSSRQDYKAEGRPEYRSSSSKELVQRQNTRPAQQSQSPLAMPSQPDLIHRVQAYFARHHPEMSVTHSGGNTFDLRGHIITMRLASHSLVAKTQTGYLPLAQYLKLHSAALYSPHQSPPRKSLRESPYRDSAESGESRDQKKSDQIKNPRERNSHESHREHNIKEKARELIGRDLKFRDPKPKDREKTAFKL